MGDKIADIINKYGGEGIPDNLRNVCEEYFNNAQFSDSDSEVELEDDNINPDGLQPALEENMIEMNIEDIPVLIEVRIQLIMFM